MVYRGLFLSDTYERDDWIVSAGKRYYVDIRIVHPCVSDQPEITIEQLKAGLPKIKRESGHSGELHTEEQEQKF